MKSASISKAPGSRALLLTACGSPAAHDLPQTPRSPAPPPTLAISTGEPPGLHFVGLRGSGSSPRNFGRRRQSAASFENLAPCMDAVLAPSACGPRGGELQLVAAGC